MKTSYLNRSFWVLITLLLGSCIEPYTPPQVKSTNNYLVVDGFLNSGQESTIRLSRTQSLTDTKAPALELNANVSVEQEGGSTYAFTEKGQGEYTLSGMAIAMGSRYRLRIKTSGGKEYLSDYTTVKQTPAIDAIYSERKDAGNQLYLDTHDSSNNTWYYQWQFEETWQYPSGAQSLYVYEGNEIKPRQDNIFICWRSANSTNIVTGSSAKLNEDIIYKFPLSYVIPAKTRIKYSILVKQYALTKDAFDYWQNLAKVTENLGSLFDPQPSQITGNIHCVTNPSEMVLGYFSAHSVSTKRIFIESLKNPTSVALTEAERCLVDSVEIADVSKRAQSQLILNPITNIMGLTIGYTMAYPGCVDCRMMGGTNVKPDFWE